MRRIALILSALLVFPLAAVSMAAAPAVSAVSAVGQQPAAGNAYDTVASCLAGRGHLLLLALIDESGSLKDNDRDNRRVDAIRAALRSFAQFGHGPKSSDAPTIELMLAAFATGFTQVSPWAQLNEQSLPELEDKAGEFAQRNKGQDTDFAAALDGAKAALAQRESEVVQSGAEAPCRLLLVFTDGQYDIDSRGGAPKYYAPNVPLRDDKRVEELGRQYLCEPSGVADQLRAADTVMVAIALRPDTPSPPDQSFLRGLAEAQTSGGSGCGDRTSPPGVLVEAQGLGQLLESFDNAVVEALGGTRVPVPADTPVCAPDDNSGRCLRSFELDRSLSEFHILVDLVRPGIAVEITPPGGSPKRLSAATADKFQLGGADLEVVPVSPLALVIDGSLPADDQRWVGTWKVRFVDETGTNRDATARAQITVFGGLTAVVEPVPTLQAGERTEFDIKVVDAKGSPRTPAAFVRAANVTAAVVRPSGERQDLTLAGPRPDGTYRTSYAVPAESTDPAVQLVLTLNVTTRDGLQLRPRVRPYSIKVQPPAGFPLVEPASLVLTRIVDKGEASGTVTVTGTPGGTGCVWFEGLDVKAVPHGAGAVNARYQPGATSQGSCIRVQPGQRSTVTVSAAPDKVRSGPVQATLRVRSTGADQTSRTTLLQVRFEMQRNPGAALPGLFAALMTLGVMLPLALLWLLNWFTARFATPAVLRRAVKKVRVTGDDVQTVEEAWASPLASDFTAMPGDAPIVPCRSFSDHDLMFRTHVPILPLRLPYGSVRAEGYDVLASGGVIGGGRNRYRGRVPLNLHPTWVFVVDRVEIANGSGEGAAPDAVVGRLFLYINEGDNENKAAELLGKVHTELPARVAGLAPKLLRPEPSSPDGGDTGGGPSGPSEQDDDIFIPPPSRY